MWILLGIGWARMAAEIVNDDGSHGGQGVNSMTQL